MVSKRSIRKIVCAIILLGTVFCGTALATEIENKASQKQKASGQEPSRIPSVRKIEIDTHQDGTPDRFEYYEEGKLVKLEIDSNQDGEIDEWGTVQDGKLVRTGKDTDGDGKPDKWMPA